VAGSDFTITEVILHTLQLSIFPGEWEGASPQNALADFLYVLFGVPPHPHKNKLKTHSLCGLIYMSSKQCPIRHHITLRVSFEGGL